MLANVLTFWGLYQVVKAASMLSGAYRETVNRLAPGGFEQLPALFIGLTPCAGFDLHPVGTSA